MSNSGGTGSRESPCTSSSAVLVSPYDLHRLTQAHNVSTGTLQNSAPPTTLGPDGQSLLCSESLSSSTSPSDDSQRLSQEQDPSAWKKSDLLKKRKTPIQYALIVSNDHLSGSRTKITGNNVHLPHIQLITDKENNIESGVVDGIPHNNDTHADNRMNTNGFERTRMTGGTPSTNENLVWLADVAVSQNQAQSRPAEGMISGRSSQNQGQGQGQTQDSQQTMLSAGASVGSVFRPSLTEPSQRVLAGGQYMSGGGSASSLGQYSSLYSVHGQPSHLAASVPQFSAFYHQYPQGYSHGSAALLAGHYPHIESYSAVLASMGSHVQHGGHSQLPRSPYMPSGHIPQYSVMGSHRTMPSASSPGPNPTHHQPSAHSAGTASLSGGESLVSPKPESQESEGRCHRSGSTSSLRDEKGSNLSPNMGHSSIKGLNVRESPKGFIEKDFYKVPSGKEGSLKHRILTRPQDSQPEGSHIDDSKYALHNVKSEEPLLKRTKYSSFSGMPSSHSPAGHIRGQAESVSHGLGPGPPNSAQTSPLPQTSYPPSHLHYPPHFMKGSIIQLANGELKRVEDLQTDDFVVSADISPDLKIDSSTVVRIQEQPERGTAILGFSVGEHRVQVTVEATLEHPFFVFGRGWSSCSAERTIQRYGLECHKLSVGDVCISLTHKDVPLKAAEISQQQSQSEAQQEMTPEKTPGQSQGHSVTFSDTVVTTHLHSSSSRSPAHQAAIPSPESDMDTRLPRKRRWSAPDQVSVDSESEQEKTEDPKPESND